MKKNKVYKRKSNYKQKKIDKVIYGSFWDRNKNKNYKKYLKIIKY